MMLGDRRSMEPYPEGNRVDRIDKNELLKKFAVWQDDLKVDRETLLKEKQRALAEVRNLEDENHIMARHVKDLQLQLFDRRKAAQRLFQHSEELKKRTVQLLAKENNLLHEIRFFETERDRHDADYREVSAKLKANMTTIAAVLRDIEFLRGETEVLMDKTGYLESGVPTRFRDIDSLDEKISDSLQSVGNLYNKMRAVEKNTKRVYYQKKKGAAENLP
jgi:chromosome segregation ATPase